MQRATIKRLGKSAPAPVSLPSKGIKLIARNTQGPFFTDERNFLSGAFADTSKAHLSIKEKTSVESKGDSKISNSTLTTVARVAIGSAPCVLFAGIPKDPLRVIGGFLDCKDYAAASVTCVSYHSFLKYDLPKRKQYGNFHWNGFSTSIKPDDSDHLPSFFKKNFPNQIDVEQFIKKLKKSLAGVTIDLEYQPWEALCMLTTEFKNNNRISALELGVEKKLFNPDTSSRSVNYVRYRTIMTVTPLTHTTCFGNLLGLKFLVEKRKQDPKNVILKDPDIGIYCSLPHLAALHGHNHILDYLIKDCGMDKSIRSTDRSRTTPFLLAAKYNRVDTMRHLVNNYKVDPHSESKDNELNALHIAILHKRMDAMKFLRKECNLSIFIDNNVPYKFLVDASAGSLAFCLYLDDEKLTAELREAFKDNPSILQQALEYAEQLKNAPAEEDLISFYLKIRRR